MSSEILKTFLKCQKEKRPALLTYTVAGDSTKKQSLAIIKSISQHADIIELGFPHNTPIADGGQIQESSHRALKNGIKLFDVFNIVKDFKKSTNNKPIILMGYYNLILQYGPLAFVKKCKKSEVDGLACGVLKEGVFFNKTYKDHRRVLVENFKVEAVISVPSSEFENTSTKTSIIIFRNTTEKTGTVKFYDMDIENIRKISLKRLKDIYI